VDRAVQAAAAAMEGPWGKMSPTDRGMLLHKLGALIDAKADQLADV